MGHTYEELHQMTAAKLRVIAEAQESGDMKGFRSLKKQSCWRWSAKWLASILMSKTL